MTEELFRIEAEINTMIKKLRENPRTREEWEAIKLLESATHYVFSAAGWLNRLAEPS